VLSTSLATSSTSRRGNHPVILGPGPGFGWGIGCSGARGWCNAWGNDRHMDFADIPFSLNLRTPYHRRQSSMSPGSKSTPRHHRQGQRFRCRGTPAGRLDNSDPFLKIRDGQPAEGVSTGCGLPYPLYCFTPSQTWSFGGAEGDWPFSTLPRVDRVETPDLIRRALRLPALSV
jgi:hypothetical protein